MFVPTLRALSLLFPGRLEVMCREGAAPAVLKGLDLAYIHSDILRGRDGDEPFPIEIIPERILDSDCLICLNDWDSPAVDTFVRAVAPTDSLGFDPVFAVQLERKFEVHNSHFAFEVVRALDPNLRFEDFCAPLGLTLPGLRVTDGMREEMPDNAFLVAIHPETGAIKNLSRASWINLVEELLIAFPRVYVVLVGVNDAGIESSVKNSNRVLACHGTSLDVSIAFVSSADAFIGIDSSMLHVADLQGTPGVGVFTVTDPLRWGYGQTKHRHVICQDPKGSVEDTERILAAFSELMGPELGTKRKGVLLKNLRDAKRPAVLFAYGIGDHLVQLPTVRALASLFPGRLSIWCRADLSSLIYGDVDLAGTFEKDACPDDSAARRGCA